MARRSLIDEWWPHLLELEKTCQQFKLEPIDAQDRMMAERHRRLPGHGTPQSKLKMMLRYHGRHREKLRQELGPVGRIYEVKIGIKSPTRASLIKRHVIQWVTVGAKSMFSKIPKR